MSIFNPGLKEMHELMRATMASDFERFKRIEEKAARMLAAASFAIAILALFAKGYIDRPVGRELTSFDYFTMAVGGLSLLASAVAWAFAMAAMDMGYIQRLSITDEMVANAKTASLDDIYSDNITAMQEMARDNGARITAKTAWLRRARVTVCFSGAIVLLFAVLASISAMAKI